MTYGVDQCRVCGKPIKVQSPTDMADWLEAQRNPPIPEKVWRARGYLAAPTRYQLTMQPAHGCCADCGLREWKKRTKPMRKLLIIVAVTVVAFGILFYVLTLLPDNRSLYR